MEDPWPEGSYELPGPRLIRLRSKIRKELHHQTHRNLRRACQRINTILISTQENLHLQIQLNNINLTPTALINCHECNAQISDAATSCPHCGAPTKNPATVNPLQDVSNNNSNVCPETHLTKAILVTLFCCWPLGIPAIVNAAGVSNAFLAGNYDMALEKSQNAKKWCKYSIMASLIFIIVMIIALLTAQ